MINIKALRSDLDYKLHDSRQMIVVPHNKVDFDAIVITGKQHRSAMPT